MIHRELLGTRLHAAVLARVPVPLEEVPPGKDDGPLAKTAGDAEQDDLRRHEREPRRPDHGVREPGARPGDVAPRPKIMGGVGLRFDHESGSFRHEADGLLHRRRLDRRPVPVEDERRTLEAPADGAAVTTEHTDGGGAEEPTS